MARKKKNKKKRLYQKIIKQNPRPNILLYSIELIFSIIVEIIRRAIKFLLITAGICVIIAVICITLCYPTLKSYKTEADKIIQNSKASDFDINRASQIYDKNGKLIAELYENSNNRYLKYDKIPRSAINAFVAIEDRTFWKNEGYDIKGIVRVVGRAVVTKGEEQHGASTITQQLVKNIYLTSEKKLERKIKEIFIAQGLSEKYSKEQIMEFYINDIYYGNGAYGLASAARIYFDTKVDELSISQIAYLCSIPNRPSYYDPYKEPENAIPRRDKILRNMLECDYISQKQYKQAIKEEIKIKKPKQNKFYDYATTFAEDCVIQYLMKLDGFEFKYKFEAMKEYNTYHEKYNEVYEEKRHNLYTNGYKIKTSLDLKKIKELQKVLDKTLSFDKSKKDGIYKLQGALTCVDNKTGKVVAVVGGRSQKNENRIYTFNRAFQSYRQPGSSIKPLVVYTPALSKGYTPSSIVEDISVSVAKKTKNVSALHGTRMTLRSAVENSRNGVAWKLFHKITPEKGLSYLEKMHFSNLCPMDYNDASALGGLTYGTTTVEMAGAYAALSNEGKWVNPDCLLSIKKDGKELYKREKKVRIYSSLATNWMADVLKGVLTKGTARQLNWSSSSNIEAFAKTGTTNNSKDGWLCGSTSYYSIAVWVGYDTPKSLSNLYGATYPGQIWKDSMLLMCKEKSAKKFYETGYYSYLPGRSDSEVIGRNYTVANYREDHMLGEKVEKVIKKMEKKSEYGKMDNQTINALYNEGMEYVKSIYGMTYKSEMLTKLNNAFAKGLN